MALVATLVWAGCSGGDGQTVGPLQRQFVTEERPGCMFASPLLWEGPSGPRIIVTETGGTVSSFDPETGETDWKLVLPTPEGEDPMPLATPALVGDRLVLEYHTLPTPEGKESGARSHANTDRQRLRHRVVVVDLTSGELDPDFEPVELEATLEGNGGPLEFLPGHALGRSEIEHVKPQGSELGRVYATYGNAQDIQPWHGWAFEVDLDVWREQGPGSAQTGVLATTHATDCGPPGHSGSRERRCGGGLWAPSGSLIVDTEQSYELVLAPGNGELDPTRDNYANTLMRVKPGLEFDPECDPDACADFDPDSPSKACIESCDNLFIPRVPPGAEPLRPDGGRCEGLTMFECWAMMDYIGGSTPAMIQPDGGPRALAYPTKDGHIYVVDYEHFGTLHDRAQVVAACGTADDPCELDWAGMMVTEPAQLEIDGTPVIATAAFMPDDTHPAGVVAFNVVMQDGRPHLERRWEFPDFDTEKAVKRFRRHPSRITIEHVEGEGPVGWIVEPGNPAYLYGIRMRDGSLYARTQLQGSGIRYVKPVVHDGSIYVPSCRSNQGPSHLEAYKYDTP
jgi:hypothetical protein